VIVALLAAVASFVLFASGVAVAATDTTNFEGFTPGSVDGQDGWKTGPNFDQAVVSSGGVPTFGLQSLRMSNLAASLAFTDTQTFSTPVVPPAGETLPNTVYIAKFSFFDPSFQDGLLVTVSPDSGEGSRMAWVGLQDEQDGIHVTASDSSGPGGDFVDTDLGVLPHGVPHTIEFRIKLIPGDANDRVRILIDGRDFGQCFTTWETYYRTSSEQSGAPNFNKPPNINSLQFRASQPTFHLTNAGYLFDNVTVTTGTGPASPGCDVTIDKQADTSTVSAGGLEGYRITARNRGRAVARNLRICDRIPRRTTFVRADRKLRRVGRQRCFVIPRLRPGQRVSVHLTLRVDASAPPGRLTNIADVTPGVPGLRPPPALAPDLPGTPAPPGARVAAVRKAKALVRVVRRVRPSFTG
jgi:uncharacterized repeat protein (TIGR01451 family)